MNYGFNRFSYFNSHKIYNCFKGTFSDSDSDLDLKLYSEKNVAQQKIVTSYLCTKLFY